MERKATYIRAWREAGGMDRRAGGYTLDEMVGRLEVLGVKITGASLSRIERGKQPYSQDLIEAIAEALDVTVAHLVEHNPDQPAATIISFDRALTAADVERAQTVLRAMFADRA
jgi:transcriptional regulator with XRE-family HTH domain